MISAFGIEHGQLAKADTRRGSAAQGAAAGAGAGAATGAAWLPAGASRGMARHTRATHAAGLSSGSALSRHAHDQRVLLQLTRRTPAHMATVRRSAAGGALGGAALGAGIGVGVHRHRERT